MCVRKYQEIQCTYYAGVSSAMVGGAVGGAVIILIVVLLCGFGVGVMAVYLTKHRKRRKHGTYYYIPGF